MLYVMFYQDIERTCLSVPHRTLEKSLKKEHYYEC